MSKRRSTRYTLWCNVDDITVRSRQLLRVALQSGSGPTHVGAAETLSCAYDDARAAIAYVRRQRSDAESIASSLYAASKRSKEQDHDPPISRPRSRSDR